MTTTRRSFLALALAGVTAPAIAHTPYNQWVVYRQKHLLVGAHRGDLKTYELAQAVVAGLKDVLPEAQARVARGPRPERIASLIGTGQLFLAVMSMEEADRMAKAEAPFEGYRPTPVTALADLGEGYVLYAAPEFPDDHAHLVTAAVVEAELGANPLPLGLRLHTGAAAFWSDVQH